MRNMIVFTNRGSQLETGFGSQTEEANEKQEWVHKPSKPMRNMIVFTNRGSQLETGFGSQTEEASEKQDLVYKQRKPIRNRIGFTMRSRVGFKNRESQCKQD